MVVYSTSTHGDVGIQHTTQDGKSVYLRAAPALRPQTFHDVADRLADTLCCRTPDCGRFAFAFPSDSTLRGIRVDPARDTQPMQITRFR